MAKLEQRAAIRNLMEGVAAEMKWAVQDIRHELVDRAWFDRTTTPLINEQMDRLSPQERDTLEAKDYREAEREDLYGRGAELPAIIRLGDTISRVFEADANIRMAEVQRDVMISRHEIEIERDEIRTRLKALRIKHENEIENRKLNIERERVERHYALMENMLTISKQVFDAKIDAYTGAYQRYITILDREIEATRKELNALGKLKTNQKISTRERNAIILEYRRIEDNQEKLMERLDKHNIRYEGAIDRLGVDLASSGVNRLEPPV